LPDEEDVIQDDAAPRSFWSGTISFGLVSIPVDLYPASRSLGVSLRMLDEDGTPLARRYFCSKDEEELESDEIVRGFELDSGEYVVVTDDELEGLEPQKSRDIDLRRFVPVDDIDPIYFERAYFLTPAGGSTKAYRLLAATMERTGRAGIATFVMRGKEYLIAIIAEDGILRAETLRFHDEVRSADDIGLPERSRVKKTEVTKVAKAIRELAEDEMDPRELEDDYAERLLALVAEKQSAEQDVVEAPVTAETDESDVIDLMEVIKRSLKGSRAGGRADERDGSRDDRDGSRRSAREGGELAAMSKKELYEQAGELGIEGRSRMSKDELIRAISASR
jgi:DNA end-binding protein Ku